MIMTLKAMIEEKKEKIGCGYAIKNKPV